MTEVKQFRRELGLGSSTMLIMGVMIGSGIFIVSADISRTVGSAGYLILVWILTGLVTLMAALAYGELAGMMPHAGGQYVYLRQAYNPFIGFLYGWTLFLIIQTGTIAAVAMAFAKFFAQLLPLFGEDKIALQVGGKVLSMSKVVAITSIVVLTWINSRGLRLAKWVQNSLTVTKILALLAVIVVGLLIGRNPEIVARNFHNLWQASWTHVQHGRITGIEPLNGLMVLAAMGVAMVGSLFSSDAWNNITFAAAEVVKPKRTIPLSLALGTASVTVLYILANLAYLCVLPVLGEPQAMDVWGRGIQFASADRVATAAAWAVLGDSGMMIMAVLIMISTFGCNNGLILAGARVYYAMAQDGLFFKQTGRLNRHSVPGAALWVQAIWACLLCLTGSYSDLLDYVIFAVLIFYVLTIAGVFILRIKAPQAERPYRAFGYPCVPALYILIALGICLDLLIYKPDYTWPGVLIVAAGAPVYWVWRKFGK